MKREIIKYFVEQLSKNYFSEKLNKPDNLYDESLLSEEFRSVLRMELAKHHRTKDDTFLVGNFSEGYSPEQYRKELRIIEKAEENLKGKYSS